jgi:uncharacterized phage protein gp47/JayE
MVRINDKTIDDFLAKAQDALQNSLIETGYSFTYEVGTINYILEGFAISNERIYSIESIEGTGFLPENYITDGTDLIEGDITSGYDYELFDNYSAPEIVPDGYGTSSGKQVYSGISIADQTFKDGSTVHIKYKYQNLNYIPILTNFSPNSILRMILTSTLLNLQETNSELIQSIETFGLNATGTDLDRLATIVGLERTEAVFTTGQIKLVNNDTVNNYSVSTSHRFAAISGGTYLAFAPLTGISVPKDGGEVFIDTIAVESGSIYNVGSNSISIGFTNIELTSRTPTTLIISNPPLGDIGQQNLFNNGTNDETDEDFRKRVSLAFSQTKTSSYSTIEKAIEDTNLADHIRVYDIDNKKDLAENAIQSYVATETGAKLAASSLTQILEAIETIKPAGSRPSVRQTLNTYINFDLNIYVDQTTIGDTTSLETELTELIDEFINSKGIGEDILPSSIVSIIKGVNEVLDVEINNHTITEFASEVATYDGQINIATAGVADNWIALEIPLNSATNLVYDLEGNISGDIYNLVTYGDPYPIDDRTSPRVNIGVTGYDGLMRPSPLDRTDYWVSETRSTITYNPGLAGGDGITTTDYVLFNYNYFDNTLMDGLRIRLGGDSGNVVGVDFGYGSNPDDVNFYSFVTDESVLDAMTVTLDGTEKLYDIPFELSSVPVQLDLDNYTDGSPPDDWSPDSTKFWIILKYSSGSGDSYLPVDTQQTPMAFSPTIYEDADTNGTVFETSSQKRANWHSYTTYTNADAYKKIVIPSQTDEPEKPISYIHTFNFALFVEE